MPRRGVTEMIQEIYRRKCEFGIVICDGIYLREIIEKPTFVFYSDGTCRWEDGDGSVVKTQNFEEWNKPGTGVGGYLDENGRAILEELL